MKKMIFSLLAIAATMNVMAAPVITSKAKVTLSCTGKTAVVQVAEVAGYSPVEYYDDGAQIKAYFIAGSPAVKYEKYYAAEIKDLKFGFKANTETAYKLKFEQVSGTIYFKDVEKDTVIAITDGMEYNFTATANAVNDTRFVMYVDAPVEPAICHQYGVLTISGYKGQNVVVKTMDGVEKINKAIDADVKVITLDELTAGEQYKVVLDGKEMIIRK